MRIKIHLTLLLWSFAVVTLAQDQDAVFTVRATKHITLTPDTAFITTHIPHRVILTNLPPGRVNVTFSKGTATLTDSLLVITPQVSFTSLTRAQMEKTSKNKNSLYNMILDEGILLITVLSPDSQQIDSFSKKFYITIPPTIQLFDVGKTSISIYVGDRNLQSKSFTFHAHNAEVFSGFDKPFTYRDSLTGTGPSPYGSIELKARTMKGDEKLQCKGSTLTKAMLDLLMAEDGAAQYGIQLYPIGSNGKIDENIFDLIYVNFDNMAKISVQTTRQNIKMK